MRFFRSAALGFLLCLPAFASGNRGIVAYEHVCRPDGLIVMTSDGFVALQHLSGESFTEGEVIFGNFAAHGIGRFFNDLGSNGYFRLLGWRPQLDAAMRLLCE